ncbi:MAG: hypothetical protein KDC98_03425 [Planctomycetes bacterium]|nr:hypothetical protein [Planctomycetota bacterium]
MAQGLRTQVARLTAAAATSFLAGCGEPGPQPAADPPSGLAAARAVDLDEVLDGELTALVLAECHALLRGSMQAVTANVTLPDGDKLQCHTRLPNDLRVAGAKGKFVQSGDSIASIGEPRVDGKAREVTTAEHRWMVALRDLLDIATFGPLYRARGCRRIAAAEYEIDVGGPTPMRMRLHPGTLLPAAFEDTFGTITIDDYLHTPATWIPAGLTHPELGRCRITFEKCGQLWRDDFFLPDSDRPTESPRIRITTESIETRSPVPVFCDANRTRWLVLDDPGTWQERAAIYAPLHDSLLAQRQKIAGFPILTRIDDKDVLVIPFRPREGDELPPLAVGRRVLLIEAGRELVVHPPDGDFEHRRRDGERMLRAAMANNGLEADGEIRCQPYFHFDEGAPQAADLAAPVVRMSVRIRD